MKHSGNSLKEYLSFPSIAAEIAKIACAKNVNRRHFSDQCFSIQFDETKRKYNRSLAILLPPRKQWLRPPLSQRKAMNPNEVKYFSIYGRIMRAYRKGTLNGTEWGRNLNIFSNSLQAMPSRLEEDNSFAFLFRLSSHTVQTRPNCTHEKIRLISEHSDLRHRIFWGLIAKCLRDSLEPFLDNGVYAFRGNGSSPKTAIYELAKYRKSHASRPLYVAECDIISLYDSIPHWAIFDSFRMLSSQRAKYIDPIVPQLIEAFLKRYSLAFGFLRGQAKKHIESDLSDVFGDNQHTHDDLSSDAHGCISGQLDTRFCQYINDIRNNSDEHIPRGLPTGSPLSPVLANLALLQADIVARKGVGTDAYYCRYADNIILAHPEKNACEYIYRNLTGALSRLTLDVHKAESQQSNTRKFISQKTKGVYEWAPRRSYPGATTWVSLLGHSIKCDGTIKISEQAIQRLIYKQNACAYSYIIKIASKIPRSTFLSGHDSAEARLDILSNNMRWYFSCHLYGRRGVWPSYKRINQFRYALNSYSLLSAYSLLTMADAERNGFKCLDRNMERLVRYVRLRLYQHYLHNRPYSPTSHNWATCNYYGAVSYRWPSVSEHIIDTCSESRSQPGESLIPIDEITPPPSEVVPEEIDQSTDEPCSSSNDYYDDYVPDYWWDDDNHAHEISRWS